MRAILVLFLDLVTSFRDAFMASIERNESNAYLVGSGIAALASAVYLIREGGLAGENIRIFEQGSVTGGHWTARGRLRTAI